MFDQIFATFTQVGNLIVSINEPVNCFVDCINLLLLLYGCTYISSLRNRKREAVFGYWSQLIVRLRVIRESLDHNYALLNNMYSDSIRDRYEEGTPDEWCIDVFRGQVDDLVEYLKTVDSQIPAYRGWSNDFDIVLRFASYVTIFDITKPDSMFIDKLLDGFQERDAYCEELCSTLSNIINSIQREQLRYERMLVPFFRSYFRDVLDGRKCQPMV